MYVYYDEQGILRECVNDLALRQYADQVDDIYIYLEGNRTLTGLTLYIKVNDTIGTTYTRVLDLSAATKLNVEVPYSSDRTLKYFEVGKRYTMIKYALTSDDLAYNGSISIEPVAYFTSGELPLGKIVATVSESNIQAERNLTYSEYLNLMETINRLKQGLVPLVDITGKTYTVAELYENFGEYFVVIPSGMIARYKFSMQKLGTSTYGMVISLNNEYHIYTFYGASGSTTAIDNGSLTTFLDSANQVQKGSIPNVPSDNTKQYLLGAKGYALDLYWKEDN